MAPTPHTPKYRDKSFTCPRCAAFAQQEWFDVQLLGEDGFGATDAVSPHEPMRLWVTACLACHKQVVWAATIFHSRGASGTWPVDAAIVHPRNLSTDAPPPAPHMPEAVAALYSEAASISALSPRAAAALLRVALEAALKEQYPDQAKQPLTDLIGWAKKQGLPEWAQQAMDVVRFKGNKAAHEVDLDDGPDTAATLFVLVNTVVEVLIARPRQIQDEYDSLPETVRANIDRRDAADE